MAMDDGSLEDLEEVTESQISQESSVALQAVQLLAAGGDLITFESQSVSSLLIVHEAHSQAEGDSDIAYQNIEQLVEADDYILDDLTLNKGGLSQGHMQQLQNQSSSILLNETTHLTMAEESLISL